VTELLRSPKGKIGAAAAAGLIVLAAMWFLLVAPQRSKAQALNAEIATSKTELAQRRLALVNPSANVTVRPGDLFRLTKALPDDGNMPGILLDVNRLAKLNGLQFQSLTPQAQIPGTGYVDQPIVVGLQGRFGDVSRFLGNLRSLVSVRHGRLDARGRMYSVSHVEIGAPDGAGSFPIVAAKVTVDAYTFSAPAPTTPATGDQSTTTPTTTTPSSSGTVAAGATP
jgi:hypothetical protein